MFSNSQQGGFISVFYSVGSNPLALWDKQVKNGHIRRVIDEEVKSLVLDIGGTNVATTYITCPINPRGSLAIKLPYLVMIIKNMKKYFSFEIQILDDKDMRRRFRVSNFQSTTKVRPFCTSMPIGLSSGWNQVQFNLADFTKRAYASTYVETIRVQIHANVRIRRIYFTDQLHSDEDLPNEFKLFAPGTREPKIKASKEFKKPSKEVVAVEAAELVPPLKIEPKEEEVPPPPSPAEESPTDEIKAEETTAPTGEAKIEVVNVEKSVEAEAEVSATEGEILPEAEAAKDENEVPTESAAEGETKPQEVAPTEQKGEGAAPPQLEEVGQVEGTESAELPAKSNELAPLEASDALTETAIEGGGAVEEDNEPPSEAVVVKEEAHSAESEPPVEAGETVQEAEPTVEEPTDNETVGTTEATEGEASPELPTTDEGEP